MFKELRNQILKMTFVLLMLGVLGVWQFQFVVDAIYSNVFLNMTIFGTFGFGAYIAYKNVLSLRNEIYAFEALREDYEDRTNSEQQQQNDPYWRYYRCEEDGIVFQKPHVLEHPYQIISEELGRTNTLAMSTGTMQNLSDSVGERLDDQKSLVQYVTGILVFLGLIGTFVGLMVTLGSVGDIIGNLDLSGGAGAEAIQGLMDGLKVPLQGMATGFSSSLFGLITSLALGLMARFANQGSSVLKTNFEAWLAGVAMVGEASASKQQEGFGFQERQLSLMFRVARFSLVSNAKLMTTVDALSDATQKMLIMQGDHLHSFGTLTQSVGQVLQSQDVVNRSLIQTNEVLEDRKKLAEAIEEIRNETTNQHYSYEQVNQELERLTRRQSQIQEASVETTHKLATRDDLSELMAGVDGKLAKDVTDLRKSIESVTGIVRDIDITTKMTQNRKVELDADKVDPLVKALTKAIANRGVQASSDGPEVPMEDIRTKPVAGAHPLTVQEMRARLYEDYNAVEESQTDRQNRLANTPAPSAISRFFKGNKS